MLGSVAFSNAPGLKCFLQFIVSAVEEGRSDEISEYAIATQVFGRPPKFDPSSDTIVRTQAYRLRLKLKEYYEGEGKGERITIEVPKGHYVPLFQWRPGTVVNETAPPTPPTQAPAQPEPVSAKPIAMGGRLWVRITGVVLLALVMFAGGAALGTRWLSQRPSVSPAYLTQGIEIQFWSSFLNSNRPIIVSFWDFYYLVSEGNVLLPTNVSSPMMERAVPADPKARRRPQTGRYGWSPVS